MTQLPSNFNLSKLTFGEDAPIRTALPPREYTNAHNGSVWGWFNNLVSNFGSWLTEFGAIIIGFIVPAIPALWGIIKLIGWVFGAFEENFIFGVLAIFGALFVLGIGFYVYCIAYCIVYAIVWALGWVCYNVWTLLAAVAIGLVIWGVVALNDNDSNSSTLHSGTEYSQPAYTLYQCTVPRLNVRAEPNNNSKIIGGLLKGAEVHVYGFEGDFARVEWDYSEAYVSKKYIEKM